MIDEHDQVIVKDLDELCEKHGVNIVAIIDKYYKPADQNISPKQFVYFVHEPNARYELKILIAAMQQDRFYNDPDINVKFDKEKMRVNLDFRNGDINDTKG